MTSIHEERDITRKASEEIVKGLNDANGLFGEAWERDKERESEVLNGPEGMSLHVHLIWNNKDRLEISGCFNGLANFLPYHGSKEREKTEITVARTRPIAAIVKEINRRLIPPYKRMLTKALEAKKAHDDYIETRDNALKAFAKASGLEFREHRYGGSSGDPVVYGYDNGVICHLEAKAWSGGEIEIKVRVPLEKALEIARVIRKES